jgi:drug/metabolite transporter (DMT)-like permease
VRPGDGPGAQFYAGAEVAIATMTSASHLSGLGVAVWAATSLGALGLLVIIAILALNDIFTVGATLSFAASGNAERLRRFVAWQIVGAAFGLGVNVTFAGLVRYWSLSFANAAGTALAFVSAQVFAAYLIVGERFDWPQWLGTALVFFGVVLIALGPR